MATASRIPPRALLGVYRDAPAADRLVDRLRRAGVPSDQVRVGAPTDRATALGAEMQQETGQSFVSPQGGVVYPKETVKASALIGPVLVAVGVLVALPFALIEFAGWDLWLRALVLAVVGGVGGGAIAAIVIPAMSVKNPQDPSAADEGVVVRVATYRADIEALMVEAHPRRLDRLGPDDAPIATVTTEEDEADGGILQEVRGNFAREHRAAPEQRTR